MVAVTDLKIFATSSGLGGAITGTQIPTATPNNVFSNVPNNERVVGEDYYACVFLKNTHSTEAMDNFKLWLSTKSFPRDTEIKWGYEPNLGGEQEGYRWSPFQTFNGSGGGVVVVADAPELDMNRFTVACWFRTTDHNFPPEGEGMMITKGGWLSNDPNKNLNYGLWHSDADNLRGGFENAAGDDFILTTSAGPNINDGIWHHACVTYDGVNVRLYKDGIEIPESPLATGGATPATSTNPLVIGDNSFFTTHLYFTGDLDEVYIWDEAISEAEVIALYENNIANPTNLVYSNHFGADDGAIPTAQTIADKYTAPLNVVWRSLETEPAEPDFTKFAALDAIPIWIWYHVNANAVSRIDDNETWTFQFDIPVGGTGSGGSGGSGGGTGGNPPPTPINYKVAFAGDWGCEPETNDVIDLIQSQGYNYVVGVGDNAYESASCWTSRFSVLKPNFNSAYGNHEYSENGGITPYKTFFGHSLTYFTFKFQNILFLVLDTNISLSSGSAQHTFITNALNAADTDNTILWKIAVMHDPWFGSNSQHNYNESNQVQAYHQLFTDKRVSLVICGHNHNWQRTYQVAYNSGSPTSPTIVDNSSPYSRTAGGLIHVITGTGGHDTGNSLYSLGSQPGFQAYQDNDNNGVWEIVASNSGNTLTCSFVNVGGSKFDTFVLNA